MLIRATIRTRWLEKASNRISTSTKGSISLSLPSTCTSTSISYRFLSTSSSLSSTSSLRNISISAHVDSGKTTLTERLLHLTNSLSPPTSSDPTSITSTASSSSLPGDVDSGSTVTDFLEAERRRGITIQSAAVGPIFWPPFINLKENQNQKEKERMAITLVDTPGHIDFSIEVERALRVVDGNIVLLDAVEGVEAQTETVWKTAKRYGVKSTLLFINKLDRQGASISKCLNSIMSKKLHPLPLLLQLPLPSNQLHPKLLENNSSSNETSNLSLEEKTFSLDSGLVGLIDIISLEKLLFNDSKAGEIISKTSLLNYKTNQASLSTQESNSNIILKETLKARNMLIETLANHDDELLEILLEKESTENYIEIGPDVLKRVIRRLSLEGVILPVFLGSAAKNVGIQPLLDGVRDYLPSPVERDEGYVKGKIDRSEDIKDQVEGSGNRKKKNRSKDKNKKDEEPSSSSNELSISKSQEISIHLQNQSLVALAFKVIYDKRKGPLTFVRIYSGTLKSSDVLFNTNLGKKEKFTKILLPYADQYVEVEELTAGKIGVLIGLKDCMTGDTLIDSNFNRFESKHLDSLKMETEEGKEEISNFNPKTLKLREINIPPPVFSISIEPLSKSDELPVLEALEMLIRTDPSLRLDDGSGSGNGSGSGLGNAGTGQMILSGMGELHLEISKDRLKDEFGVRARIGKVRVSFRESIGEEMELESIDNFETYSDLLEKIHGQGVEKWKGEELLEKEVAGKKMKAGIEIEIRPLIQNEEDLSDDLERNGKTSGIDLVKVGGNLIEIDLNELENDSESSSPIEEDQDSNTNTSNHSISSIRASFVSGLTASISRGPLSSSPITNLYIKLSKPKLFGNELSSLKSLNMVSNLALRNLIKNSNPKMMEPVMKVTLRINKSNLGKVVGDLTGYQDGVIDEVLHSSVDQNEDQNSETSKDSPNEMVYFPPEIQSSSTSRNGSDSNEGNEQTIIKATVPLSNLVGYSTRLRALTGGTGNFEMEFKGFKRVSKDRQLDILKGLGRA